MVKFFYLRAKSFLGFYIYYLVFLDKLLEETWNFFRGFFPSHLGTVSLCVFLHMLRFKKVLPPRLIFPGLCNFLCSPISIRNLPHTRTAVFVCGGRNSKQLGEELGGPCLLVYWIFLLINNRNERQVDL